MKTIAVVTDSKVKNDRPSYVGDTIRENIQEVFADAVIVKKYYIDELSPYVTIDEDLILIMAGSRAIKLREFVAEPKNIILARRTFLKGGLEQLYQVPEGSDVLVVNDNIETVLECVSSLYNIGIKHVNLIAFEPGKDFRHINYAISPSEMDLIPDYIKNVYNVDSRVMDIPTMLLLISRLGIDSKEIQQNLYNYYQKIFSVNESVTENYNNLLTRTEELDYMLDLSHDAIVLTNPEGRILVHNKKFNKMFDIVGSVVGEDLHTVVNDIDMSLYYKSDYYNDVISFNKRHLNLEKKNIVHFNKEKRMYFSFQEVTYIKKLEQNLSQKLRQKGQIAKYYFEDIVTESKHMKDIIHRSRRIAETDLTVLITGESGTGKEVLAQAIHNASDRRNQPFIAINGSAIPDNLLESELFGYVRGSFTGALKQGKKGLFELANNGTIFLDEIGDMPMHLQSKLLRVLQERQITPIGSDQIIDIDVRVIAATHKNPIDLIELGQFRKDLFYRLNVFPIELPPLRKRIDDIPLLLDAFTKHRFNMTDECRCRIMGYKWPGNIRELHNVANYVSTVETSDIMDTLSLPQYIVEQTGICMIESRTDIKFDDKAAIEAISDFDLTLQVLASISFLNEIKKTAGRKHILELLHKNDIDLQESSLRKILLTLSDRQLIVIKKGRSGSHITPKGEKFLLENN